MCGGDLEVRAVHGAERPTCARCGYVYFMDPKVAVMGLVVQQNRILLVQRAIEPGKGLWALPGGYMDAGEMPDEALRREVMEETGVTVHVGELLGMFGMDTPEGERVGVVMAFAAQVADGESGRLTVGADVAEARWFDSHAIPRPLAFESSSVVVNQWLSHAQEGIGSVDT
jgi:ADP-ribose pyrophosphatase YjhB (NUDIX family)